MPRDNCGTLAAIGEEEIAKLPATPRTKATRRQKLDWPRLTEPRQLVTKLVENRGLKMVGGEQIPHDLWPAGSLSELSLAEQLTVLLVGFDLTFVIDAEGQIKLTPISEPVKIARQYQLPVGTSVDQLKQLLPGLEIRVSGRQVTVDAVAEVHDQLEELLRLKGESGEPTPVTTKTRKLYTLRIEQQAAARCARAIGPAAWVGR